MERSGDGNALQRMRLHLAAFLYPTGYHVAAWRHPAVPADAGISFPHYASLARIAERGCFDMLFLADSVAMRGRDLPALSRGAIRYVAQLDPLVLLSGLAAVTRRIGLAASATTTYNEPYHLARKLASLDHLSGGRAAWNLVTSQNEDEAPNFGHDAHPPHAERYARAREFAQVVTGLWDSWEDDAFVRDKDAGVFFDPEKLHVLDHRGEHFSVRGPLNVPRPPQGRPVILQAGSSDAGRALAAETAEVVFTAQTTLAGARAFAEDVRERAARAGRAPERELRILVGVFPFVGRTSSEAEEEHARLQALIEPLVARSLLEGQLGGVDLSGFPLDGPLPPLPETNAGRSRRELLIELARRDGLSIGELARHVAGGRGHLELVGSPQEVADELEAWAAAGAADGFVVMAPWLPGGLERFVDLVIPELQRRGLFRTAYEGHTLREHLRLARPEHPARRRAAGTTMAAER
jgi:FMN-dependent oxidoreductase (nitrilotriacetate monooxygenase family)